MYELHSQKELKQTFREGGKYEEQLRENFRFGRFIESGMMDEYLDAQLSRQGELPRDLMELSAVGCQASMSLTEQDFEGRISLSASKLTESDSDAMKVLTEASISDRRRTQRERKRHLRKCKKLQKSALSDMKKAAKKKERGKDSIEERCDAIMSAAEAQKEYLKATCKDPKTEEYLLACADIRTCRRVLAICQDAPGYKKLAEKTQSLLDKSMQKLTGMEQFRTKWQEMNADEQAQKALDQQSMQKILDQSAQTLRFGDLEGVTLEDFSAELLRTDKSMIARFVADNTVEMQAEKEKAEKDESLESQFDTMLQRIKMYKSDLGGGSAFAFHEPTLDGVKKTFFGIPYESCQEWANKQYKSAKNKFTKSIFSTIGSFFGAAPEEVSQYETSYRNLLCMRELVRNKDDIIDAFQADERSGTYYGTEMLAYKARMTCHERDNGAGAYPATVASLIDLYTTQYSFAVMEGREREFFENIGGVCFEDKFTHITEYAQAHPLGGIDPAFLIAPPDDGSLYIRLVTEEPERENPLADPVEFFSREVAAVVTSNHLDPNNVSFDSVLPHMKRIASKTKLFPGGKCTDIDDFGATVKDSSVDMDDAFWEKMRSVFNDILCITI